MTGVFVSIVGPSGVGKDTLLRRAQAHLATDPTFHFVQRLVTRPGGSHEDHLTLSEEDFATGVRLKLFALAWRAHGLGYAVPVSVHETLARGAVAVCNVSRGILAEAERVFSRHATVLISAPSEVVTGRLRARGRETDTGIQARLDREAALAGVAADYTVANDCSPQAGAKRLVAVLRQVARN